MNSTLFVLTGDHGSNFANRNGLFTTANQYNEEMFDVGVTFHTKMRDWQRMVRPAQKLE